MRYRIGRDMRLTVPLDDEDDAHLTNRANDAGVARAAWVRGAIRAATADQQIADAIAEHADQTGWGGRREGAGRPSQLSSSDGVRERPPSASTGPTGA